MLKECLFTRYWRVAVSGHLPTLLLEFFRICQTLIGNKGTHPAIINTNADTISIIRFSLIHKYMLVSY